MEKEFSGKIDDFDDEQALAKADGGTLSSMAKECTELIDDSDEDNDSDEDKQTFAKADGETLKKDTMVGDLQIEALIRNIWEAAQDEISVQNKISSLLIDCVIHLDCDDASAGEMKQPGDGALLDALFLNRFKFCFIVIAAAMHYSVLIVINDGDGRFSPNTTKLFHIDPLGYHVGMNFDKAFYRCDKSK
jgi:hypothetical protein